jgi:hypothetical protein
MINLEITSPERLRGILGEDVPRDRTLPVIRGCSLQIQQYLDRVLRKQEFVLRLPAVRCDQRTFYVKYNPIEEVSQVDYWNYDQWNQLSSGDYSHDDMHVTLSKYLYAIIDTGASALRVTGVGGMAENREDFIERYPDIVMEAEAWMLIRLRRLALPDVKSQSQQGATTSYHGTDMPKSLMLCLDHHRHISPVA